MKTYKTIITMVAAGLACSALTSSADIVLNNDTITLLSFPGTGSGGSIVTGGTLLAQQLIQISDPTGVIDGTIDSWVLSGVTGNPYSNPGALTFIYQIQNLASPAHTFDNLTFSGFSGLSQVDIEQVAAYGSPLTGLSAGLGTGTVFAAEGTFQGVTGVITLQALLQNGHILFDGSQAGIQQNGISDYIIINTSATGYAGNIGALQDGLSADGSILAPVPETSTVVAGALMLLPFGIGALRSVRKDRNIL